MKSQTNLFRWKCIRQFFVWKAFHYLQVIYECRMFVTSAMRRITDKQEKAKSNCRKTRTHTHSFTLSHSLTFSLFHSLSLFYYHSLFHSLSLKPHSHTHTHILLVFCPVKRVQRGDAKYKCSERMWKERERDRERDGESGHEREEKKQDR